MEAQRLLARVLILTVLGFASITWTPYPEYQMVPPQQSAPGPERPGQLPPEPPPAPKPEAPPVPAPAPPAPAPAPPQLVAYDGPVRHIFFHPLIAFNDRAFDGDDLSQGYDDWFVTVGEFDRILQALYENDFILVDIQSLYAREDGEDGMVLVPKPLMLPPGKKPLILSVDDLNFYDYMRENGNNYRLVLDGNGEVAAELVEDDGSHAISRDTEIVPILDDFVRAHPDFSLNGAKGVIALTGYQGILGYRTNNPDSPSYERDRAAAVRIAERLKATGWSFASHGWAHLDAAAVSYDRFVRDTRLWLDEVEPLIGPTPVYIYPFGSDLSPRSDKFAYLLDHGFRVLCSVGPSPYYLEEEPTGYVMMERMHIDGVSLKTQHSLLRPYFDADEVIDYARPGM